MTPPNVLLVVVDPLRADALTDRGLGTKLVSLAARGTRFRQCVATSPLLIPSLASVLTGTYPPRHGFRGARDETSSSGPATMAELLVREGYRARAEVTGSLFLESGVLSGFEVTARHDEPEAFPSSSLVLDRIANLEAPWLLLLYLTAPDLERHRSPLDHLAALFDAVGPDTLVILTGAHGAPHFGGPTRRMLRRAVRRAAPLSEELVRVPLILLGPGAGTYSIEDQVRHVDLLPTITDLCGVPSPAAVHGRSLRPYLEGGDLPQSPAYLETATGRLRRNRVAGARIPDWKLVKPERGHPALHALNGSARMNERRNVYSRYPEIARDLETFIDATTAGETVLAEPVL